MSAPLPEPVGVYLGAPAFARLWDAVAERLQRNGLQASGRVRVTAPTHEERAELELLLGRAIRPEGDVMVDLAALDAALRASPAQRGVVAVAEALRGPLVDRPGRRARRDAERSRIWATARQELAETGLESAEWAEPWLDETRRGGSTGRLRPDAAIELLRQAIRILAALGHPGTSGAGTPRAGNPGAGSPGAGNPGAGGQGRGELAALYTGSAHGLDDDTLLSRLVLRGLALRLGASPPAHAEGRRALWAQAGVIVDEVSATVLTYGLRPQGDSALGRHLRERADLRMPTHLTARDLRTGARDLRIWEPVPAKGTPVHVCENPRVIEALADAGLDAPLVCTSGNPSTVVLALLDVLTRGGAELAYHGDFDWPGVTLAERMVTRYGARPWRMSAQDYESAVAVARDRGTPLRTLTGEPAATPWDPELAAAMVALGVAVHEESVLETLLGDLG